MNIAGLEHQVRNILFGDKLVGVKAVLSLHQHVGHGEGPFSLTVGLTEKYRVDTEDIADLCHAINIFRLAGGQEVSEACNHTDGITLVPFSLRGPGDPEREETALGPRREAAPPPFVPAGIKVHGPGESRLHFSQVFLEAVRWLRREDPQRDDPRVLEVEHKDEEYLFACARRVSCTETHDLCRVRPHS
jgi:hypothetical protein